MMDLRRMFLSEFGLISLIGYEEVEEKQFRKLLSFEFFG